MDAARVGHALCTAATWVVGLALGALVLASLFNLGAGIDSGRMIRAFDYDEHNLAGMLLENVSRGDLSPKNRHYPRGFFDYGQVYQTLAHGFVRIQRLFGATLSIYIIVFALRLVSFVACLSGGILLYRVARGLGLSRLPALLVMAALVASPSFAQYSIAAHPDVLQAVLIAGSVACWLGRYSVARALGSAALAGAAFGTKYAGILLLPAILVFVVLGEWSEPAATFRRVSSRSAAVTSGAVAVFAAVWLGTNPGVIPNWAAFTNAIRWRLSHVERGHHGEESTNPLEWFRVFADDFSPAGVVVFWAGIALLTFFLVRRWRSLPGRGAARLRAFARSPRRRFLVATVVYCALSFGLLLVDVNMRRMRYAFHVLPPAILLSGFGLWCGARAVRSRAVRSALVVLVSSALVLLCAGTLAKDHAYVDRYTDARVVLGNWLVGKYPPNSSVLVDEYSFLPEVFTHQQFVLGIEKPEVVHRKPDVILMSRAASGRYCWKRAGTHFVDARFQCSALDDVKSYLATDRWLASPTSGYVVVRDEPDYVVFERKKERAPEEVDPASISNEN